MNKNKTLPASVLKIIENAIKKTQEDLKHYEKGKKHWGKCSVSKKYFTF